LVRHKLCRRSKLREEGKVARKGEDGKEEKGKREGSLPMILRRDEYTRNGLAHKFLIFSAAI